MSTVEAEVKRLRRLRSATGVPYPTGYLFFRGTIFWLSKLVMKSVLLHGDRIPQPRGVKYRPKWYRRSGHKKIGSGKAFIIAANHGSMRDIAFIGMFRRGLVWVCKPFFCMHPLAAIVDQRMGAVPLFRPGQDDNPSKHTPKEIAHIRSVCFTADEGLNVAVAAIRRGVPAIIFPEGTRKAHAMIGEAKDGAARLSRRTNCPILPLAIVGCAKGDPVVRTRWLRRRVLVGVVGELIYPSDFDQPGDPKLIHTAMMAEWQQQANDLRSEGLAVLKARR